MQVTICTKVAIVQYTYTFKELKHACTLKFWFHYNELCHYCISSLNSWDKSCKDLHMIIAMNL